MNFRCYTCRATLGRGLPPLDALSRDQFDWAVGGLADEIDHVDSKMKTRIMDNTKFEGMSSGSFCAFCLVRIHEFPSAEGNSVSWDSIEVPPMTDGDPFKSRMMYLTEIRSMYKAADLSLIESLLFEGITYTDIPCWFPECTETERILLPEDQTGCHLHWNFLNCFQILKTEEQGWEFFSRGHDRETCECENCWQINNLLWSLKMEAAQEHNSGDHEGWFDDSCPICMDLKEAEETK